jgi:hypothetical protein
MTYLLLIRTLLQEAKRSFGERSKCLVRHYHLFLVTFSTIRLASRYKNAYCPLFDNPPDNIYQYPALPSWSIQVHPVCHTDGA